MTRLIRSVLVFLLKAFSVAKQKYWENNRQHIDKKRNATVGLLLC